jgi:hypothetical protein
MDYSSMKVIHSSPVKGHLIGCSMTSKGQVVLTDDEKNGHITLTDVNGRVLQKFTPKALQPCFLRFMAIDSTDQLFVCDQNNNCVHVYNSHNNLIKSYSSQSACGIAINDSKQLIISLYNQHCVTVLDKDGSIQFTIGTPNQSSDIYGRFNSPCGVAVSSNQSILEKVIYNILSDSQKISLLQTEIIIEFKCLIQKESSSSSLENMALEMES